MLDHSYSGTYHASDSHIWARLRWWASASRSRWNSRAQKGEWGGFLVSIFDYSELLYSVVSRSDRVLVQISKSRYHQSDNNEKSSDDHQIWSYCIRVGTFGNTCEICERIKQYEISIEWVSYWCESRIVSDRVDSDVIWLLVARSAICVISEEDRSAWSCPDSDECDARCYSPARESKAWVRELTIRDPDDREMGRIAIDESDHLERCRYATPTTLRLDRDPTDNIRQYSSLISHRNLESCSSCRCHDPLFAWSHERSWRDYLLRLIESRQEDTILRADICNRHRKWVVDDPECSVSTSVQTTYKSEYHHNKPRDDEGRSDQLTARRWREIGGERHIIELYEKNWKLYKKPEKRFDKFTIYIIYSYINLLNIWKYLHLLKNNF